MTRPRAPYSTDRKPALTLAQIAGNARAGQRETAAAALALALRRIEELESENRELLAVADNSALILAGHDIACLKETSAELRQVLVSLLAGLDSLPDNWILQMYIGRLEPQISAAREVVGL